VASAYRRVSQRAATRVRLQVPTPPTGTRLVAELADVPDLAGAGATTAQ
jgi:hypothetical protein